MSQSRLTSALDDGLFALPDGPVTILRPPLDYDLDGLPDAAILTGFAPEAEGWTSRGHRLTNTIGTTAVVVVPRSKALARSLIAQAAATATLVLVDGQKTDGIDSLFKDCKARLGDIPNITKAHGRLFWFAGTKAFADWAAAPPSLGSIGFHTQAGVFSDGQIDRGSALLAAALPAKLPLRMADFGAGWGYLSAAALTRTGVETIDLIEAEALSLDCARLNITDPRATFHWTDATRYRAAAPYGGIVMNPPFHSGRAADPALGRAFIDAAARNLTSSGQLWMVANRHLAYEQILKEKFKDVADIGTDPAFKIFHATRPKR